MTALAQLQKEINALPPQYYGQVIDFVGRLRSKTQIKPTPQIPETMLLSEASLAKDWNTPEEDEAWASL